MGKTPLFNNERNFRLPMSVGRMSLYRSLEKSYDTHRIFQLSISTRSRISRNTFRSSSIVDRFFLPTQSLEEVDDIVNGGSSSYASAQRELKNPEILTDGVKNQN